MSTKARATRAPAWVWAAAWPSGALASVAALTSSGALMFARLLRIGTNALYASRRTVRTHRLHLAELQRGSVGPHLRAVGGGAAAFERTSARELRDLLLRGMRRLARRDQVVLVLHDVEGYLYAEIAEILEIAPGTGGSRLSRARERLRDAVRELLGLEADAVLTREHLHEGLNEHARSPSAKSLRRWPADASQSFPTATKDNER